MSPDFILGNLKHSCICSELTKKAFLGVWSKQFLPALKSTVACCRFPRIKLYSTHGHLPTEDPTGFQQRLEELYLGIIIAILTLGHFHDLDMRSKGGQRLLLCYELPIHCKFQATINSVLVSS